MIKMGSSALGIRGDRLKEGDVVKYLAKVIEIFEKLSSMISYLNEY